MLIKENGQKTGLVSMADIVWFMFANRADGPCGNDAGEQAGVIAYEDLTAEMLHQ